MDSLPLPYAARVAVTLSFDDGTIHDRRLVSLLNELGLRATWNLNSGTLDTPGYLKKDEIVELYQGHEIAAHSVSHPCLDDLSDEAVRHQVQDDLLALQAITGAPVRGFAYPFGNYSPRVIEVLRPLGLAYARTCDNARDIFPCAEPLAWPTTCYQNATDENSKSVWLDEFRRRYDSGDSFCFHVWGHSCEFGDDWSRAREWFQTLAGFENIWSCTNLELWDSAIIGQEQQK